MRIDAENEESDVENKLSSTFYQMEIERCARARACVRVGVCV